MWKKERKKHMADVKTEKQKVKEITDKLEEGLKELFNDERSESRADTQQRCCGEFH